jgi:hypothetical protein
VDRFGILGISGSWLGVETGFVAKFVSNLTRSLSYFKKAFVQQRRSNLTNSQQKQLNALYCNALWQNFHCRFGKQ